MNQRRFIAGYIATKNVVAAAKLSGIGRSTHYVWFAKDPEYATAFDRAINAVVKRLEGETRRCAANVTGGPGNRP